MYAVPRASKEGALIMINDLLYYYNKMVWKSAKSYENLDIAMHDKNSSWIRTYLYISLPMISFPTTYAESSLYTKKNSIRVTLCKSSLAFFNCSTWNSDKESAVGLKSWAEGL